MGCFVVFGPLQDEAGSCGVSAEFEVWHFEEEEDVRLRVADREDFTAGVKGVTGCPFLAMRAVICFPDLFYIPGPFKMVVTRVCGGRLVVQCTTRRDLWALFIPREVLMSGDPSLHGPCYVQVADHSEAVGEFAVLDRGFVFSFCVLFFCQGFRFVGAI